MGTNDPPSRAIGPIAAAGPAPPPRRLARRSLAICSQMEQREIASGAAWSLGLRAASQVVQFIISIALARLLTPDAFGLVAMAATVTAFLGILVDAGLGTAIIQRPDLSPRESDSAFLWSTTLGGGAACLVLASAPTIAWFYGPKEVASVCRVGAASVFLGALGVVPRALLVRRMRVRYLASLDFSALVTSSFVALALALAGAGWWALAVAGPVATLISAAGALASLDRRPRLRASWGAARPLLGVGTHLLAFAIVNYCARNLDNVMIGAWLGERELGFYVRAYSLMLLPITEITSVLTTTILPTLSRLQKDDAAARSAYLGVLGIVALVSFPAMIGLALVAEPFVIVVFGPAWEPFAPILRLLAIVGAIQAIVNPIGWIYQSRGRTDLMFRWGLFGSAVYVAALAAGAWRGTTVRTAAFYLVANIALFVPAYWYAGRVLRLGLAELRSAVLPAALAAGIMAIVVTAFDAALPGLGAPARLASEVGIGIAAYLLACRWLPVPAARRTAQLLLGLHPACARHLAPLLAFLIGPSTDSDRA